jgi:CHAT domain-containing protein
VGNPSSTAYVRFKYQNSPSSGGALSHGDERLTLLEIVHAHLPTAEFEFLSACHTAAMIERSVVDEALHLAAAVQYCGFRNVVGTMWAMVDEDGRELAENFYKALISNSRRDQGIPYHERSAKALRSAAKKLRRKNFVHYGV